MPKIVIINGSGGTGKSTFVSLCHDINDKVIEISTVDFVKEVAKFAGWNGEKNEIGRKFLSDLKDAMEEYGDIPNKKVEEFINSHPENIIFINVREPYNIHYYKTKYNALTILLVNERIQNIKTNHADADVDNYSYDYIIENNGTLSQLMEYARKVLKKIEE